jgi:23S rRNA pseudouridine1911/1915/1917 synthase
LHAKTLGFEHPITSVFMQFDSEIPQDMQLCIDKWRAYTQEKEAADDLE